MSTPYGVRQRGVDRAMPKALERKLTTDAARKFPGDKERQDRYIYGTMRKHGWRPSRHSPWDGHTWRHWYFGEVKVL